MSDIPNLYVQAVSGRKQDDLYRQLVDFKREDPRYIAVDGKDYLNFSSNDYLGLSGHPALIKRAQEWTESYGTGSGASRLVTGNLDVYGQIEAKVARLKQKESALIFASGWQANVSVLKALFDKTVLGAEPLVFADRLNHASMHVGLQAAGVRQVRYNHLDFNHLEELLKKHEGDERPKFLLTESVFSMDGDVVDINQLVALKEKYGAFLVVDEAHATGVLGENGAGLCAGKDVDVVIGTFGKALGSFGAYVASDCKIRDYLVNFCGGLIYSTALPPPVLGAMDAALDLLPLLAQERFHVLDLAEKFRKKARDMGFDTGTSETPIVPVMMRASDAAVALQKHLKNNGLWVSAIREPTVERGKARLRVSFTAAHEGRDLAKLCDALAAWK